MAQPFTLIVLGAIGLVVVLAELLTRYRSRRRVIYVERPTNVVQENPIAGQTDGGLVLVTRTPLWDLEGPERPGIEDSTGHARFFCPCCKYPTGHEFSFAFACALCEFEEPLAADPSYRLTPDELARLGAEARPHFEQYGSVISPEERSSYGGEVSAEERACRMELREHYEYLMGGQRPDTSEHWAAIDATTERLRAAERRRIDEMQADDDNTAA